MKERFAQLAEQYRRALLDDVMPFWQRHSLDRAHGGYLTCLDREGAVYDTDKYMWLQGRELWTFAMLYNRVQRREDWLEAAECGYRFLRDHAMDARGNWYFRLDRAGRPLVQPYSLPSDCFGAIGMAQYALAAGDDEAAQIARRTVRNILGRLGNPKGQYNKLVSGARPMKDFVTPMLLCTLAPEVEPLIGADEADALLRGAVRQMIDLHVDANTLLTYENVAPDGGHPDTFEGRLIAPGHAIEGMGFVLMAARRWDDAPLAERAVEAALRMLDFAWDAPHGGLFYFLDARGRPRRELDWDQKLWWVHTETLQTLALGYAITGRAECLEWYEKVHPYAWSNFADEAYGEWFGYLHRRGERLLEVKGGPWKGCFHVPRALHACWKEFAALASGNDE